jgi:hypothetical protein
MGGELHHAADERASAHLERSQESFASLGGSGTHKNAETVEKPGPGAHKPFLSHSLLRSALKEGAADKDK